MLKWNMVALANYRSGEYVSICHVVGCEGVGGGGGGMCDVMI